MSGEGPGGAAGAPVRGPGVDGLAGDASSLSGTGRFPQQKRPLKEGGPWGKHGFPHWSGALRSVLGQSPRTRREKRGTSDAHTTLARPNRPCGRIISAAASRLNATTGLYTGLTPPKNDGHVESSIAIPSSSPPASAP